MKQGSIISRAHAWVQNRAEPSKVLCERCGITTPMNAIGSERGRCKPHNEFASSGFRAEPA